jgi:hypothetical protein
MRPAFIFQDLVNSAMRYMKKTSNGCTGYATRILLKNEWDILGSQFCVGQLIAFCSAIPLAHIPKIALLRARIQMHVVTARRRVAVMQCKGISKGLLVDILPGQPVSQPCVPCPVFLAREDAIALRIGSCLPGPATKNAFPAVYTDSNVTPKAHVFRDDNDGADMRTVFASSYLRRVDNKKGAVTQRVLAKADLRHYTQLGLWHSSRTRLRTKLPFALLDLAGVSEKGFSTGRILTHTWYWHETQPPLVEKRSTVGVRPSVEAGGQAVMTPP